MFPFPQKCQKAKLSFVLFPLKWQVFHNPDYKIETIHFAFLLEISFLQRFPSLLSLKISCQMLILSAPMFFFHSFLSLISDYILINILNMLSKFYQKQKILYIKFN